MSDVHSQIARDLDEGAVRMAVSRFQNRGAEITVSAIADEAGLPTHRVEPHLRALADQWVRDRRPTRFV